MNSDTSSAHKKGKKTKKTKLKLLKAEKKKLQNNLKGAEEDILEDNKRKASPSYTPYENRKNLARTAFDAVSKLQQIEGEIVTKQKENKQKDERKLTTQLKKRFIKADMEYNRLIKMTTKLERMKMDEKELRAEITRELREDPENPASLTEAGQSHLRLPCILNSETSRWIKISTTLPEGNISGQEDDFRPACRLSESVSELPPIEKKHVADRLSHKYDMTRELRNTIHEHMIARSYSVSYFSITSPYKQFKPKPQKSKKAFNRMVLEDKIGVNNFGKMQPKS